MEAYYGFHTLNCPKCTSNDEDPVELKVLEVLEGYCGKFLYKEFHCRCPICKTKFVRRAYYVREEYETEEVEVFPR